MLRIKPKIPLVVLVVIPIALLWVFGCSTTSERRKSEPSSKWISSNKSEHYSNPASAKRRKRISEVEDFSFGSQQDFDSALNEKGKEIRFSSSFGR